MSENNGIAQSSIFSGFNVCAWTKPDFEKFRQDYIKVITKACINVWIRIERFGNNGQLHAIQPGLALPMIFSYTVRSS